MVDRYHFGCGCDPVLECLLKRNSLSHQFWETDRYKQIQSCWKSLKQLEGLGLSFRFFQFSNLFQLFNNQLCQDSSVSFFWKGEIGIFKNGKCQLLKIGICCYFVILLKS